jgi:hypothetical protein
VVTSIDVGIDGGRAGRQLHAPDLDQAPDPRPGRADRQLQRWPLVTSIDVEIGGGRADRRPVAPW